MKRLLMAIACALLVVCGLLALLPGAVQPLQARPLATGRAYPSGSAPCNSTLQACISGSADGDRIVIAPGTYLTAALAVTRDVSLIGGGSDPTKVKLHTTAGRIIQYSGVPLTASFVISNLSVENGDVSGTSSSGGGIRVLSGSGVPVFANLIISGNIATGGGGIRLQSTAPATLINVTLRGNSGTTAGGGGILASGSLTLVNSNVLRNRATTLGGGISSDGELRLFDSDFEFNQAESGGGGAFATSATVVNSRFDRNFVSDTVGLGASLLVSDNATLLDSNIADSAAAFGGNIYVSGTLNLSNTFVVNGFATQGGGGAYVKQDLIAINSTFLTGHTEGGPSDHAQGGGAWVGGLLAITNTQFLSNSAQGSGGGAAVGSLWASGGLFDTNRAGLNGSGVTAYDVTVSGTRFINNNASTSGSISAKFVDVTNAKFSQNFAVTGAGVDATHATVRGAQFLDNQASDTGGGIAAHSGEFASIAITDSVFLDNFAPRGGAVWSAAPKSGPDSRIVNSLFAHNFAFGNTSGAAELQFENPGSLVILHTTFAGSSLNPNPVIDVLTGTVGITNSILVSHSVGISRTAGFVYEDFNLFFGNTPDRIGSPAGGGHDLFINPLFIDPAGDNYHLMPNSPAIDAGGKSGITTDFDGQTRPLGLAFDIGFDEVDVRKVYLPVVLK